MTVARATRHQSFKACVQFLHLIAVAWVFAIALAAAPAAVASDDDPFVIFKPVDAKTGDRNAYWEGQLRNVAGPDDASKSAIITALADYETNPSAKTALGVLQHFSTFADHKDFRFAAFGKEGDSYKNIDVFLTLDALKYELVIKANQKMNAVRGRTGRAPIAYFLRVGSSGERYLKWVEWAASGKSLDGMPADAEYILNKLFYSDDDVTNVAHPDAEGRDPVVNEELNGKNAIAAFMQASEDLGLAIDPRKLKTEFLSPTKAYGHLRTNHTGFVDKWPDYLEALVRTESEKYNGLFTEEQLHAWGVEQGVVTEMQVLAADDPRRGQPIDDLTTSTRVFAGSAAAALKGDELFPEGINDVAGWMMNNYRQAFIVHSGNLKDVAKYTLRMIAWWDTFDLKLPDDLVAQGIELPAGLREAQNFEDYRTLLNAIRQPQSVQEFETQIAKFGGAEQALGLLKTANRQILLGGHRKHVSMLADHLRTALKTYHETLGDTPGYPRPPPPTLAELLGGEADFRKNKLLMSLTTLAGAYGNLPPNLVRVLNEDLATFIQERGAADPDGTPEAIYNTEVRKYLMLALDEAQSGAGELRRQTRGIRQIETLRAELDAKIDEHLQSLSGVDFDSYILQVAKGTMQQRRLRLIWDGNWPSVAFVSEQWTPDDVAQDLKRIHALAKDFGWSDETYAQRLKDYFAGDPPLAVGALRALDNLFDPTGMETRFISYEDADGNTVRLGITPTRFVDPALNMGLVTFKMAMIGGEAFKKGWKIWGDLDETKKLAQALSASLLSEGRSRKEIAQAYSQALTSTINLAEYAEYISSRATKPALFDVAGETLTALATMSQNPYPTDENIRDLSFAALKDLTLYVNPHLATVYLLHGVYNWASTHYVTSTAESDLVELLVKNGDWDIPDGRQGDATLKGLYLSRGGEDGTLVANEAAGPPETLCRDASGADLIKPPVMAWLAKNLSSDWESGIALRSKGPTRKVLPRKALLDLFYAGPLESQDPILDVLREAVRNMPGDWWSWGYLLFWDQTKNWNQKWLKDLGIVAPTPDDSNRLVEGDVRLAAQAASDFLTWRGFLDNAESGTRRNFGYLVSQYWVQRQILLEGPVICAAYKKAARQVLKEDVTTIEVDFLAQVRDLDRRMEALDRTVWPNIARSADRILGATYEPNRDFPLRDEFRGATDPMRERLREIEQLLGQRGGDEVVPLGGDGSGAAGGGGSSSSGPGGDFQLDPPDTESAGPTDVTDAPAEVLPQPELLKQEAQDILGKLTDLVYAYEDDYGAVLARLSTTDAFVTSNTKGETGSFAIAPYHVRLYYDERRESTTASPEEVSAAITAGGAIPGTESTADNPIGAIDRALLNIQHLIDFGPGADAKLAAEEWEQFYREEFETVRTDLGNVIADLLRELRPLGSALDSAATAADTLWNWLEYLNAVGPYELAEKHPLWDRLIRLRFQMRKLDNMIPTAGKATRDEIAAAVGNMVLKKGEEIALPGEGQVLTPFLSELAGKMQEEYDRLLQLTRNMFNMQVNNTTAGPFAATDRVDLSVENSPFADLGGPDAAEIKKLVKSYWWEIAPAGGSDLRDPDCLYLVRGDFFVDRKVKSKRLNNQPLRAAGKFAVRVTALGEADIPLAQVKNLLEFDVAPATITGEIKVDGEWGPQIVSGYFGIKGKEQPQSRFQLIDTDVDDNGRFVKPLCYFYPEEFPNPPLNALEVGAGAAAADTEQQADPTDAESSAALPGGGYPPNDLWTYAGVRQGTQLDPRSPAVDTDFVARAHLRGDDSAPPETRAHFRLRAPLRLQGARMVSVTVDVRDASDEKVSADTFVIFKGEEIPWNGPLLLRIEPGEEISAVARRETLGGPVEGRGDSIVYDPETLNEDEDDALSLRVEMPFFDTGNLHVSGHFTSAAGLDPPVEPAEGTVFSDFGGFQAEASVAGASFSFENDAPARLEDGLLIDALLFDADGKILKPTARPFTVRLAPRKHLDLEIAIAPSEVTVEPIVIAATDWAGNPLPEPGTRVSIGDDAARRVDDRYEGAAIFRTRQDLEEGIKLKAEHDMPDGSIEDGETRLTGADIGSIRNPEPPSEPEEIKLQIYNAGKVKLAGRTALDLPDGAPTPDKVKLKIKPPESPLTIEYEVQPGAKFELRVDEKLRLVRLIEVVAEAQAGDISLSGRGAASVPVEFGTNGIAIADVGTIHLAPSVGLVVVPDIRGLTVDAARVELAKRSLKLAEAQNSGATPPTPDKARLVYEQEKIGDKVPRESAIPVEAYGASTLVAVPSVVDLPEQEAAGILAAAGFEVVISELDPAEFTGEPGIVLAQIPQDWAEPGAPVVIGLLKTPEPEPEPEPDEPAVDDGPTPVVTSGGGIAGPWAGKVYLTSLVIDGSPTTSEGLFDRMLNIVVRDLKKDQQERQREEAERQRQSDDSGGLGDAVGALAEIPGDIAEGIMEGIGTAIMLVVIPYGKAALDILDQGVDVSFALQEEAGGYRIIVPEMPTEQAEQSDDQVPLLTSVDGRTFTAKETLDPESGAEINLSLVMNEDHTKADLVISASGRNTEPGEPGDIRSGSIKLAGEFTPGELTYEQIETTVKARIEPLVEAALVKVMTRVEPYLDDDDDE